MFPSSCVPKFPCSWVPAWVLQVLQSYDIMRSQTQSHTEREDASITLCSGPLGTLNTIMTTNLSGHGVISEEVIERLMESQEPSTQQKRIVRRWTSSSIQTPGSGRVHASGLETDGCLCISQVYRWLVSSVRSLKVFKWNKPNEDVVSHRGSSLSFIYTTPALSFLLIYFHFISFDFSIAGHPMSCPWAE